MRLICMLPGVALSMLFNLPAQSVGLVQSLRVPENGIQPQAVIDRQGDLHLIYLKGEPAASDISYTRRSPGGSFSPPLRVNSKSGSAVAMGTVRGPQVCLGKDGMVQVAWNGSAPSNGKAAAEAGFFYSRLTKGKFSPQRNLMKNSTRLDGGGSLASDSGGHVYAFWHGLPVGAAMEETNRTVFLAKSSDDGETFLPDEALNMPRKGACGCCGLKAASIGIGKLAVLYRSADGAGSRDIIYLGSSDFGKSFQETVLGPWPINACPLSTMSLTSKDARLMAAWESKGKIWTATGGEQGTGFGKSNIVRRGSVIQKHPTVVAGQDKDLFVWAEGTGWGSGGDVAWVCRNKKGETIAEGKEPNLPAWSKPTAVAQNDGTFLVIY